MIKQENFRDFFILRMAEIFHKDTLDSYRVRTNNAMSILVELRSVLDNWLQNNIKNFKTVSHCITECKDIISADKCLDFSFYDKELFITDLSDYNTSCENKKDKNLVMQTKRLKTFVEMCISNNESVYLNKLVTRLENVLYSTDEHEEKDFIVLFKDFDYDISSFSCELLRKGFSKSYLYWFFKCFKRNSSDIPFDSAFKELKEKLVTGEKKKFKVVFRINIPSNIAHIPSFSNFPKIRDRIDDDLNGKKIKRCYTETSERTKFYITEAEALDSVMAARICHEEISEIFDFNLNIFKSVNVPQDALTICSVDGTDNYQVRSEYIYTLDQGDFSNSENNYSLFEKLNEIKANHSISDDVKDRISAALRHLRIGDCQTEIEQQFINYWIALEFIFASPMSDESTFERIKKYFIEISEACYIKRNTVYLRRWIKNSQKKEADEDLNFLEDRDFVDSINNILLKYRLLNIKSHIRNKDSVKKYIGQHRKNLEQHITRIYRLRNELIHEAAIKQDIANVTSNLRSYLILILNQLIQHFSSNSYNLQSREMLEFFLIYENYLKLILSKSGKQEILQVPLADGPIQ